MVSVHKTDPCIYVHQFEEGTLRSMINAQTEESPNEAPAPEVNKQKNNTHKNYSELVIYIKGSVHSIIF